MKNVRTTNRYVAATVIASFLMSVGATAEERMRAIDLIADIQDGETTAEAAVSAAFEAIEDWAVLNGVAHLNFEAAMTAARAVDDGSRTGALAGLPVVVKDNIRVEGLPNAAGTPALQEPWPTRTRPCCRS
jgi:indoleacetamide hydrolase